MNVRINIVKTKEEILSCYAVLKHLRPDLIEEDFVKNILRLQETGYQFAVLKADDNVAAVAGFHLSENLAWKKFLYVDDLVTLPAERSKGYGKQLLTWLHEHAKDNACDELHLDSGVQRKDAHRFYKREGMALASYHFSISC